MNATLEPLMTAEEFATQSRDYQELVNGKIVPVPPKGARNGLVNAHVIGVFGKHIGDSREWVACSNDTFVLTTRNPDTVRGGDLVLWRQAVVPEPMPDLIIPPPELVVEVRGPLDTIPQMLNKATEYLAAGIKTVLVVDWITGTVCHFTTDQMPQRFESTDTLTLPEVLPGFSVEVKKFFE